MEAMDSQSLPFVLTQPEFMRRMKEMQQTGGGMFGMGSMPEMYNLIVNTNHALVSEILNTKTKKKKGNAATPSLKDCANCGAPEGTVPGSPIHKPCSRCKITYYCSVRCQKQHWKEGGHNQNCVAEEERSVEKAAAAAAAETPPTKKKNNAGAAAEDEGEDILPRMKEEGGRRKERA